MPFIDRFQEKTMYEPSQIQWLLEHWNDIQRYLDSKVDMTSHPFMWDKFRKMPSLGMAIANNWNKPNSDKIAYILDILATQSMICTIIGQRGWGKTAFALWLAEKLHEMGKVIWMAQTNMPLPKWIVQVDNPFDAPEGTVIIIDEAAISYSSRNAMTREAKDMAGLLAISRHRGLSVIFASQHSGMVDINILRMTNLFFFKRLSWEEMESKELKSSMLLMKQFLNMLMPTKKSETLFSDGENWYLFNHGLPSFWSDAVSRTYRQLTTTEAVEFALKMSEAGQSPKTIARALKVRGIVISDVEVQNWIEYPGEAMREAKKINRGK